jgi:hypothetical protein
VFPPPKLEKALIEISNSLTRADIRWVLVGSTATCLNGLNVKPEDIDIIIEREKVYEVDRLFASKFHPVRRVKYGSTSVYSSHYGVFMVYNVKVEIMADLTICGENGCLEVVFEDLYSCSRHIKVGKALVKVAPLEWQLVTNIMIPGKESRVKTILNDLKSRGMDTELLNHLLKNIPQKARMQAMRLIESR